MEEEAWPDPGPSHWSQSRGSHDLCRNQCRIGLSPDDTQLSTRNAWLWSQESHDLIEGVSKCMISGQEAQAKFNEFREAQGSHDEVYTDGSKMNERVGAAVVINRHFQNGETTCRQLSKRLPDNSTIFAAEATAISLALNYYQHMDPVHHDVVVYSDSMSCLQALEGEDSENPFICHIMNPGHWVTRAHVFVSAGYQATVALTEMKEWIN